MATQESMSEAALARKRRIALRRNRQRSSSASSSSSSSATISSFVNNEEEIKTSVKNSKRSLSALLEDDEEEGKPIFVSSATSNCEEVVAEEEEDDVQQTPQKKQKPHITGIKKQSRYDPGVTLNKEELKAWRKEARRVRNRESAAASRKKNRESIESLQTKVDDMKAKYTAALQYILDSEGDYEPQQQQQQTTSTTPSPSTTLRQDLEEIRKTTLPSSSDNFSVSRSCSPVHEGMMTTVQTVSPPTSPIPQEEEEEVQKEKIQRRDPSKVQISNNQDKNTPNNHPLSDHDQHYDHHPTTSTNSQSQHIIDTMISRPIACV
ncbi:MAG: hypothetical protein ACI90V_004191 [Bacillariaceae sp.]|jgi:hypothetical protein